MGSKAFCNVALVLLCVKAAKKAAPHFAAIIRFAVRGRCSPVGYCYMTTGELGLVLRSTIMKESSIPPGKEPSPEESAGAEKRPPRRSRPRTSPATPLSLSEELRKKAKKKPRS